MPEIVAFMTHELRKDAEAEAHFMEERLVREGFHVFYPQKGEYRADCGMVLTFGGDGTLLKGAALAMKYHCPLMGINMGTVGFLTEGDPEQREEIILALLEKKYDLEKRELLQVQVSGMEDRHLALNDVVITRGGYARLIQVETRINSEHWGTFTADGVIAATPTGSTGYSLSAGGPVIAPGVPCTIITPVCAHSMQHCPCIVPANAEIIFNLKAEREQQAQLQIDGRNLATLHSGDTVRITDAEETIQLVRLKKYRFFSLLRTKLNEWGISDSRQ